MIKKSEDRRKYMREYAREYRLSQKYRTYHEFYTKKIKNEVFSHYGKMCSCCGEEHPEFLTIDHIELNGPYSKGHTPRSGLALWKWLIKHKFPKEFRILCMNCNWARGNFGQCPHERERVLNYAI